MIAAGKPTTRATYLYLPGLKLAFNFDAQDTEGINHDPGVLRTEDSGEARDAGRQRRADQRAVGDTLGSRRAEREVDRASGSSYGVPLAHVNTLKRQHLFSDLPDMFVGAHKHRVARYGGGSLDDLSEGVFRDEGAGCPNRDDLSFAILVDEIYMAARHNR